MKDILVDTDVILDMLFDNKPFSDAATALISLADQSRINVYISAISYCKLYEEMGAFTSPNKLTAIFRMLFSICNVIEVNSRVIQRALNLDIADFSKAIQYASALQNDRISVIISNNINQYKNSRIPVMTPNSYLKLLSQNKVLIEGDKQES